MEWVVSIGTTMELDRQPGLCVTCDQGMKNSSLEWLWGLPLESSSAQGDFCHLTPQLTLVTSTLGKKGREVRQSRQSQVLFLLAGKDLSASELALTLALSMWWSWTMHLTSNRWRLSEGWEPNSVRENDHWYKLMGKSSIWVQCCSDYRKQNCRDQNHQDLEAG